MKRRARRLAIVAAGAVLLAWLGYRLVAGGSESAGRGPLQPLAGLAGTWSEPPGEGQRDRSASTFTFGAGGMFLREERTDPQGAFLEERVYYWHAARTPEGGSLALLGLDREGTVREGILREDDEGCLELRFNSYPRAGGGASYRERIRFLDPDRIVRSLHEKTEEQEVLAEERTLRRSR